MNILYLDPVLGISGDMTISALLDAGCPFSVLTDLLGQLPVSMPSIEPEKKRRGAIVGTHLLMGPSDIHLSVTQMRQMIEGLDTQAARQDGRGGHPRRHRRRRIEGARRAQGGDTLP